MIGWRWSMKNQPRQPKTPRSNPKVEELADTLNQDVGSPLTQFIADIQFFMASGGGISRKELGAFKTAWLKNRRGRNDTGQAAVPCKTRRKRRRVSD